ncbi:MAG: hypothetical protein M1828_005332 [Chrysothrix sp. TS-e1954]|nr:MAG: hypothetical protein M1828_005332 [Chrysothrix sp. TS-e1954]
MAKGFLDLPGEIRNKIYRLALQPRAKYNLAPRTDRRGVKVTNHNTGAGIVFACKRTYAESLEMLYDKRFDFTENLSTIRTFLESQSTKRRRSFARLGYITNNAYYFEEAAWSPAEQDAWKYIISQTRLKQVTVYVKMMSNMKFVPASKMMRNMQTVPWPGYEVVYLGHRPRRLPCSDTALDRMALPAAYHNRLFEFMQRQQQEIIAQTLDLLLLDPAIKTSSLKIVHFHFPAYFPGSVQSGSYYAEPNDEWRTNLAAEEDPLFEYRRETAMNVFRRTPTQWWDKVWTMFMQESYHKWAARMNFDGHTRGPNSHSLKETLLKISLGQDCITSTVRRLRVRVSEEEAAPEPFEQMMHDIRANGVDTPTPGGG